MKFEKLAYRSGSRCTK